MLTNRFEITKQSNYLNIGLITWFIIDHNFWTTKPSKSIKVSKDSNCSLVSNKNLSEILPSSSLGPGLGEMGQGSLYLWYHSKKTQPPMKKIFFIADSPNLLRVLNSSLAQSSTEVFPCKNTYKLLDFSLRLPEAKVLSTTHYSCI